MRAWEASILRVGYALAKLHRENLKPVWVNEAMRIKAEDDYARWRGGEDLSGLRTEKPKT